MINWICGAICGSGATLLLYSILTGKMIQEEQDKATKCIFKYEEYRRKIRHLADENKSLVYQIKELEEKLKSSDYSGFNETK